MRKRQWTRLLSLVGFRGLLSWLHLIESGQEGRFQLFTELGRIGQPRMTKIVVVHFSAVSRGLEKDVSSRQAPGKSELPQNSTLLRSLKQRRSIQPFHVRPVTCPVVVVVSMHQLRHRRKSPKDIVNAADSNPGPRESIFD